MAYSSLNTLPMLLMTDCTAQLTKVIALTATHLTALRRHVIFCIHTNSHICNCKLIDPQFRKVKRKNQGHRNHFLSGQYVQTTFLFHIVGIGCIIFEDDIL